LRESRHWTYYVAEHAVVSLAVAHPRRMARLSWYRWVV